MKCTLILKKVDQKKQSIQTKRISFLSDLTIPLPSRDETQHSLSAEYTWCQYQRVGYPDSQQVSEEQTSFEEVVKRV